MASGDPAAAAHAVVQAAPRTPRVAWCGHLDGMRLIRELDPAAVIWLPWADPQPPTADDLAELRPAVVNMPHLVVGRALAAIRSAADAGARTVEVDVHVTRDGQVVLVHDDTLERLWGVDARVAGLDLADVRALGGGDLRIPLLADALELLAGTDVELVIDMASG
ncbi:glycerophosphodiester phosphodiesterase, partial [Clavibacter michiganensis]|uniref:glycerophosphodiester phosphodiesterase n=1 Tax=Clavibacter michiganensis TaxID=28447 RepID=UPI002930E220